MNKIAFVFPGQGTHYVGMGLELAKQYKEAADVYKLAGEVMGLDIRKLCFEGPEEEQVKTQNAQPIIHTTSMAILKIIEAYGIAAGVTAGFSLGQYTALVYARALRFEDTIKLVKTRGELMENAVPMGLGKMCWITGLSREEVAGVIEGAKHLGHIQFSNYNCPGHDIIAGYNAPLEYAQKLALERGAKGADFLRVSGPFHTSLLHEAGLRLRAELDKIEVQKPQIMYVDNVLGDYCDPSPAELKELLKEHVYNAVRWEESMAAMLKEGVDTFIEIGSKSVLTSLNIRCIEKEQSAARCFNVRDAESLAEMLRAMRQ